MSDQTLFTFARMTPAEYRDDYQQMRLTLEAQAPRKITSRGCHLKVGDMVKVYQKPLTREAYEGEARIVRIKGKSREGAGTLYRAVVNFPEDGPDTVVERTIAEGDVLA